MIQEQPWVVLAVLLTFLVDAVLFAALGLFYHLFTRRMDLNAESFMKMWEEQAKQIESLAEEVRSVSPLQSVHRINEMQKNVGQMWNQVAELSGRTQKLETDFREIKDGFMSLDNHVKEKIAAFMRDLSREIVELRKDFQKVIAGVPKNPAQVV